MSLDILYTNLVKGGIISLNKLIDLMSTNPKKRFNLEDNAYTVWNLEEKYVIDSNKFQSKGKSTPFNGYEVNGEYILSIIDGKVIK